MKINFKECFRLYAEQYRTLYRILKGYFACYGGWKAVLFSPLFGISFAITIFNYSNWMTPTWPAQSLSVLPNLLGFSLGCYALLFSLLSERLRRALLFVKNPRDVPYLHEINATFLHFILIQVASILYSLLFTATIMKDIFDTIEIYTTVLRIVFYSFYFPLSFLGFLLFVYSVTLTVGAAISIYRIANIEDKGAQGQ